MSRLLTVIIPASNEERFIGPCLTALFASDPIDGPVEVIVVANGCKDRTADVARSFSQVARAGGWGFQVLDLAQGSKPGALNAGDAAASGDCRLYLDADIVVSPQVMSQLGAALARPDAVYVAATPVIPRATSAVTRAYGRFWQGLPFAQSPAGGYGLFAVNAPARARWGAFPAIISDDTFVRLQFHPHERIQVPGSYEWPMIEGFGSLVKVRRRQDAGVRELREKFPGILEREGKAPLTKVALLGLILRDPVGFCAYGAVSLMVRLKRGSTAFTRGR